MFAISILLAYKAAFSRRLSHKKRPEPITFTITLLTLAVLIIGRVFGEDFKGSKWIYAETSRQKLPTQNLTLRKNGTFRVDLNEIDFSCYFTGEYQKHGDTILFDKDVAAQTHSLLATKYLLSDGLLKPISDSNQRGVNFSDFTIIAKR